MSANPSAYEILGLEPGADQAAVELAYRELIKRYHPDREGGDEARAAEINGAYRELRRLAPSVSEPAPALDLSDALYARRMAHARRRSSSREGGGGKRRLRLFLPILAAAVAGILFWRREPLLLLLKEARAEAAATFLPAPLEAQASPPGIDLLFGGPLNRLSIDAAVERAALLSGRDSGTALIQESESCLRRFREAPTLAGLDACAGFDDAVLEIEIDREVQGGGRFAASAVTARQIAAAKLLSADYQAIEIRLDRVRSHVRTAFAQERAATSASGVTQPSPGAARGLPPLVSGADGAAPH